MSKTALKEKVSKKQKGKCALTGETLPIDTTLIDTDRLISKRNGGTYHEANTRVVDPVAHMERHGNLRDRPDELKALKIIIDSRNQIMKTYLGRCNQIKAIRRHVDDYSPESVAVIERVRDIVKLELDSLDKQLEEKMKEITDTDTLAKVALQVPSVGMVTTAYCLCYLDLTKANHASSLWSYVGLDKPSHKRYTKGEKGGGNKNLRTALYNGAMAQMRSRGPYRQEYDRIKARLMVSERLVETRDTKGNLTTRMWKDTKPSHKHGAAIRVVMKHFLADWWYVGRLLLGLPVDENTYIVWKYPSEHSRTIRPEERGWDYKEFLI